MPDRIVLADMVFQARHGLLAHERTTPQRFEVDVELHLDLVPTREEGMTPEELLLSPDV